MKHPGRQRSPAYRLCMQRGPAVCLLHQGPEAVHHLRHHGALAPKGIGQPSQCPQLSAQAVLSDHSLNHPNQTKRAKLLFAKKYFRASSRRLDGRHAVGLVGKLDLWLDRTLHKELPQHIHPLPIVPEAYILQEACESLRRPYGAELLDRCCSNQHLPSPHASRPPCVEAWSWIHNPFSTRLRNNQDIYSNPRSSKRSFYARDSGASFIVNREDYSAREHLSCDIIGSLGNYTSDKNSSFRFGRDRRHVFISLTTLRCLAKCLQQMFIHRISMVKQRALRSESPASISTKACETDFSNLHFSYSSQYYIIYVTVDFGHRAYSPLLQIDRRHNNSNILDSSGEETPSVDPGEITSRIDIIPASSPSCILFRWSTRNVANNEFYLEQSIYEESLSSVLDKPLPQKNHSFNTESMTLSTNSKKALRAARAWFVIDSIAGSKPETKLSKVSRKTQILAEETK
jgi:hypothetical protein